MKVLLVDDDQALLTVFETALKQEGFEVVTSTTGKEALDKANADKFDFIFLDQILPDISGNDVLKTLKSQENTKNIPVAIVSNFSQDQLMQDAINMGADDYIYKYNIEPQDLAAKVKEIVRSKGTDTPQQPPQQ
jgi:DNA-binding response OmpR family regulator